MPRLASSSYFFTVLILSGAARALAQLPEPPAPPSLISEGEQAPTGEASGTLVGEILLPNGDALPGATLTLVGPAPGRRVAVSDLSGRFRFLNLPAGRYSLTAEIEGFATAISEDVEIRPGLSNEVRLVMGGPISVGELSKPTSDNSDNDDQPPLTGSSGQVRVEVYRTSDDLKLQAWLNEKTRAGFETSTLIPTGAGESIFVFTRRQMPQKCTVIIERDPIVPDRLAARLEQHLDKALAGIHFLGSGQSALILCHAP